MQGLPIGKLLPWKQLSWFLLSIAVLAGFIYSQNPEQIGQAFISGLSVFPAVILVAFFYQFLQTFAWQLTIDGKTSFWSLFRLETAGNALRSVIPFSLVGGDPVQSHLLRKKQGIPSAAASIVTDRSVQALSTGIFVWMGLTVGFLNTPALPNLARLLVPAVTLVIGLFCIVAVRSSKQGFFAAIVKKTPTLGLPCRCQSPAYRGMIDEHDRHLLSFYNDKSGAFYQGLILHLICQGLMTLEVYLIGSALVPQFSLSWALALTALTPVLTGVFSFLPGAIGIIEMTYAGLLALAFGIPGGIAGVAIMLVRRLRHLVWIIIGLVFAGNPFGMFLGK